MAKKEEIYLGKSGKIFGPYTSDELDQFSKSGKLAEFTWIWDWKMDSWKPLESPPPSPLAKGESQTGRSRNWKDIQALCRDHFHILSGTLESVTETGCTFVSHHDGGEPKFSTAGIQILDLYDPVHKDLAKTNVRIVGIERQNHSWIYRLRWSNTPSFPAEKKKAA